jgi:hypothetical protein
LFEIPEGYTEDENRFPDLWYSFEIILIIHLFF